MILKVSVFVIGLFIGSSLSASIDCNIEKCAKATKVYEELGCKAVSGAKSCCAKRFECPDFKKLDENMCNFEGKEYALGEVLPRNSTDSKCSETCFCTRQENEPAKFACTSSNCGVSSFKVPGCINVYGDLNECCSTSIVCDDAEKETLATCFVEQEYREGEKFIPASNSCYECLCHKDFDNSTITDNPYCRKLNCEIDLRYKSFVQRGCLPVFHSEKCCPVDWECPKHGKKVVKRATADEESQTAKQELFIVTPSKNMQEYLDIVRLSNAPENDEAFTKVPEITSETVTIPSTESNFIPTLSTNPFEAPIEQVTVSVAVKKESTSTTTEAAKTFTKTKIESSQSVVSDILSLLDDLTTKKDEETRKADAETVEASQSSSSSSESSSAESTEDFLKSTESSPSSTKSDQSSPSFFDEFTETTSQAPENSRNFAAKSSSFTENSSKFPESSSSYPESSNHSESFPESQKLSTESPPTISSTKHSTTTVNNHSHSSSSESDSESKSSEEEDDEKKHFDDGQSSGHSSIEHSEEKKKDLIRKSTSAAPVTIIALSTTSDTSVILTTETPKDSTRSLESPEELTTLSEKSVEQSEVVTEDSLKSDFSVTEAFSTSETTIPNESSSTNEASTFSSSLTEPSSTQFVVNPNISIQEVFTESSPDVPVTTEEEVPSTTSATIPALNPVAPTEFEKLLSTLRDFVAKIDQFTTAAPQSSALPENVQKSVEYVNYTVSSGSEKVDAVKSISKRSVPDADLNPRYFKQHYSSNKDKGCNFNGRNFKLGEPIKTDNGCLKCICEYAPIGHCMLKEKCDF